MKCNIGEWWLTIHNTFAYITYAKEGELCRADVYRNMFDSFPLIVNTSLTDSYFAKQITKDKNPEFFL